MPRGARVRRAPACAAVARGAGRGGRAVPGLRHGGSLRRRRASRGVPVVCRHGAGVVHRHARLHHARHGAHPQAQGLRRTPPRQASLLVQVTLVAKGDVPLSIAMTVCSTLAAVFFTPLLIKVLAGAYIPVDAAKLSLSTLQVVVAPILLGSSIQTAFPSVVQFVTPFAPLMAVLASSLLACSVFSENFVRLSSTIADASSVKGNFFSGDIAVVMLSVSLLHFAGFFVGYAAAAIGGLKEKQRRAISIEVGMQNSSLGVVLAAAHFSSPLVALPPALSAVIMNIMGSTLGLVWQYITPSDLENETTGMHNA